MVRVENKIGKVWLVGAGTGDVGLITRKGLDVLQKAEVVVYDALVSLEILALLPEDAELIDAGKRSHNHLIPQERTNEILLEKALEGKRVVRLKGGDPFVFGRGGEELELLASNNVPYEIIPGITSSIAVPAYNGIPVTHRDFTSSFHVITGHKKKDGKLDIDFSSLVKLNATLVFLMGVQAMEYICDSLIEAGMGKDMPAAILERGTTSRQRRVVATVSTLKDKAEEGNIKSPAVIVVGRVCALEENFAWFEKKPLFGIQVMITRPKNQISRFAQSMRELGAQVIEMPTIQTIGIKELEDKSLDDAFFGAVAHLGSSQDKVCVTFTSPQGVKHFFTQLREFELDLRKILANPNLRFAVIGNATRKELESYSIFPEYMPENYCGRELGELLAKELDKDCAVYLFRAEEGTKELTDILSNHEIPYYDITTYRTVYRKNCPVIDKMVQAFSEGEIDYVTFTSASTVKGFVNSFEHVDYSKIHALCIGEQTAKEARKYGMKISISEEATIDSMIQLLLNLKKK